MSSLPFVGRKEELEALRLLLRKKTASLVVIQGRRRIGKSRLIREFGQSHRFLRLSGIPPTPETTAQSQRDEFAQQLSFATGLPEIKADDWNKLFLLLAREVQKGRVIILLDEISWMGSMDPDFPGKLKNAWDLYFKENPELILILCGSISSRIEGNILGNTGFLGRVSLSLQLKEFSLPECNDFFTLLGDKFSAYEKFKILSVTGGIPRYLEEIQSGFTADENIRRLCFMKSGILFREFKDIFSDLFDKKSSLYVKILETMIDGGREHGEIYAALNLNKNGHFSEHLDKLILAGFVTRDYTWILKTGKEGRLSHYRLSDNYVRFYLKYIQPNKGKIEGGYFINRSLSHFPGWGSMMGLQFENLVLNNRIAIWKKLHIQPQDIISDNPFFQRKTVRMEGCQFDYLIHVRHNIIFCCEIKFSHEPIKYNVILEMKKKIEKLSTPKGFSCKPILIYVNGLETSVVNADYFANHIDFSELLKSAS